MNTKGIAIILALSFFAAAMVIPVASQESDAVSAGMIDVFIMTDTTTGIPDEVELEDIDLDWVSFSVTAYDAAKAIMAVNTSLSLGENTYSINSDYTMLVETESYSYIDVDPNYGEISKFLNLSNNDISCWHAWIYVGNQWQSLSSTAGLGHVRPFEDYSVSNYRSANVALFYGTDAEVSDINLPSVTRSIISLSQIQNNSNYAVTFTLKDASGSVVTYDAQNAIGYGSDVYAALKNLCLNTSLIAPIGTDTAGQYYSWITSINGKSNATASPWTPYWAFFTNDGGNPGYASFTMGFYSPLDNGYNSASSVLLTYGSGNP